MERLQGLFDQFCRYGFGIVAGENSLMPFVHPDGRASDPPALPGDFHTSKGPRGQPTATITTTDTGTTSVMQPMDLPGLRCLPLRVSGTQIHRKMCCFAAVIPVAFSN